MIVTTKNCLSMRMANMPSALITSTTWNRPSVYSAATCNQRPLHYSDQQRRSSYTDKLFLEGLIRSADEVSQRQSSLCIWTTVMRKRVMTASTRASTAP